MMNDMMTWGGGAMMWAMGLYGVLVIVSSSSRSQRSSSMYALI